MKSSRRNFIQKSAALATLSTLGLKTTAKPLPSNLPDWNIDLSLAYFFGYQPQKMQLARQMNVLGAVTSANPSIVGMREAKSWEYEPLAAIKNRFEQEGLQLKVVEGPPSLEKTKLGLDGRDEEIGHFITFMKNIARLGIRIVCYNWMPVISWHRSKIDKKGRGDALVTAFDYEDVKDQPLTEYGEVSAEKMWQNMEYFLKAVIPEAEKLEIRLALHPDDPPIPSIRGISRIMISVDAFKRLIDLYPSPSNGITFCQGTFATMGEDIPSAIEYFGKRNKIFFVHFRDIRGTKWNFEETFHDEGITDMYLAMKKYHETGFTGPMRPDHVPTMAGDSNEHPGYSIIGTLYALGYMRGLIEAISKAY
ncbi:MAG: mannonate dehydratase [Cyclobacteriaceae bacterium]|nr:mannonate dehydratase [Cyclobacteriaceae bacterium]